MFTFFYQWIPFGLEWCLGQSLKKFLQLGMHFKMLDWLMFLVTLGAYMLLSSMLVLEMILLLMEVIL